jgi:hypothetical protein
MGEDSMDVYNIETAHLVVQPPGHRAGVLKRFAPLPPEEDRGHTIL